MSTGDQSYHCCCQFPDKPHVTSLESQLAAAQESLRLEEAKTMDWNYAFECIGEQLATAKAEIGILKDTLGHQEKVNLQLVVDNESENKRLREALEKIVKLQPHYDTCETPEWKISKQQEFINLKNAVTRFEWGSAYLPEGCHSEIYHIRRAVDRMDESMKLWEASHG